jgi:L-idonate 5-dehydrogenase
MRAVVIHAAKDLRIEPRPTGEPGPGEVVVRLKRGGICGSDLHYYNHGGFGTVRLKEPMILGHEVAGEVVAVGAEVTGLVPGDRVAVSPSRPDWGDIYAREGMPNQSLGMRFYGSAMPFPHVQGAFREVLIAEAAQCAKVPAGVSDAAAAMAEPLAVCLHAVTRAGSLLGKRVLVTGCGPIGVLTILAARRAGAATIVATDIAAGCLAHAERAGADQVIDVSGGTAALDRFAADKGWFHVAFEASGAAPALLEAIRVVRPRGVIVQLGLGGETALPMNVLVAKELELRGTFRFHDEFFWAVELMGKGLIDVEPLVSDVFPMSDAVAAFERASDRSRAMKVQIAF